MMTTVPQLKPFFSIIIPVFNRATRIRPTLNSVCAQTFTEWEAVIVDDGSDDGQALAKLVASYHEPRFTLRRQDNSGGGTARNTGIDAANGLYVSFLDSDDIFLPNKLERLHRELAVDDADTDQLPVGITHYSRVDRGGGLYLRKPSRPRHETEDVSEYLFSAREPMQSSTLTVRKDCAADVRFEDGLRKGQDLDFALRLVREKGALLFVEEELSIWMDRDSVGRVGHSRHGTVLSDWFSRRRHLMTPRARAGYRATVLSYEIAHDQPVRAAGYILQGVLRGGVSPKNGLRFAARALLSSSTFRKLVRTALRSGGVSKGKAPGYLSSVGTDASLTSRCIEMMRAFAPDEMAFWLGESETLPEPVAWQDHCDIVYTLALLGSLEVATDKARLQFSDAAAKAPLFASSSSSDGRNDKTRLNAHITAYILGGCRLIGHQIAGKVNWRIDDLVDPKSNVPRYPAIWAHHIWRVSHWIGGCPSILLQIADAAAEGPDRDEAFAKLDTVLAAAETHIIDKKTGLLRPYRSELIQSVFKMLYRFRHDPELGRLGGIAHILWINWATGRRYQAGDALVSRAKAVLLKRYPFMEEVPYCLDFDIIQLVRTANSNFSDTVRARAKYLMTDTAEFLVNKANTENFTLHKIPGALAAMHEACMVSGETKIASLDREPIDIIERAGWL